MAGGTITGTLRRLANSVTSQNRHEGKQVASAGVIDLFCGAGGLSHGFKLAGFDVLAGYDIDERCRYAYEHNNDAIFKACDVGALQEADIADAFGNTDIRILVGCAPCQPFSTYNHKNVDPKWNLVGKFGELIERTLPDIVSMENVPHLRHFADGRVLDEFVERLDRLGYDPDVGILYGPDFGLPQTRSRLVLVGSRLGSIRLPVPDPDIDLPTVEMHIGGLPKLEAGQTDPNDPLHRSASLNEKNMERMLNSKPGGSWRDWPDHLVADCHKSDRGKSYGSVYGRMRKDKPSPTITTQFYGFGNGRFGHPTQHRALSLREGAILQGFPKDYRFVKPGEKIHVSGLGRMIGNAVPVTLAHRIAEAVRSHIDENT